MYLERRRRLYYALHDIPADAQAALGKRRFCVSLECEDRATAQRLGAAFEAKWLGEIDAARKGLSGADLLRHKALAQAEHTASIRRISAPANDNGDEAPLQDIETLEEEIALSRGAYSFADPGLQTPGVFAETEQLRAVAKGATVRFKLHLDEYLATLKNEAKSIDMKRSTIAKFAKAFPYSADVERKAVQRWVNSELKDGKALATVRRSLSELRGYWGYLQSIAAVPEDAEPFDKLTLPKTGKATAERRDALAATEVMALHKAAASDQILADLIELGMWTGARIEELCSLPVSKVAEGYFDIEDAKTKAGWRRVPIHSRLASTMKRLVAASTDGFVLSGLTATKYGDRSGAIGKRFGRLKTDLGYGPEHVFHSIRKTVATLFENAGVPESTAAEIIGHDKPTMTFGLYSDGLTLEVKREAIEKLAYPDSR